LTNVCKVCVTSQVRSSQCTKLNGPRLASILLSVVMLLSLLVWDSSSYRAGIVLEALEFSLSSAKDSVTQSRPDFLLYARDKDVKILY
jgi:hypothetical protein